MKKYTVELGGGPLTGDDILFFNSALVEQINAIAESLGGPFLILSGVEFTLPGSPGPMSYTAGWVYFNNELFKVDAGTCSWNGGNIFEVVETYDPAGDVVYEDLNTVHTYIIRKAKIGNTYVGSGNPLWYGSARRLKDLLYGSYQGITMASGWTSLGAYHMLTLTGDVRFVGAVQISSFTTQNLMFTLPVKPSAKRVQLAAAIQGSGNTKIQVHVEFDTNGDVSVYGITSGEPATVYLDNLNFVRAVIGS